MNIYGSQYGSAVAVTPSDTTIISCRAIYIGTQAGDLVVNPGPTGGTSVTFKTPVAGTILPIELNQGRIMSTGSGVTNVVALA
jgi:hypothetical protein